MLGKMYNFSVAIQLFSLREEMERDFEGTLKKVKEYGYDGVEFAGLNGKSSIEVKKMCNEIGLVPISAHVMLSEMLNKPNTMEIYKEIGCKYVVIPCVNRASLPGQDKFNDFVKDVKTLGKKANELGMKLCYHNHDGEFEKIDGENILDIIYKEIPTELLQPQIDTCWVNVGGENPAEYLRKYNGRTEIVHLKDFIGKKNDKTYSLIGRETDEAFELRPIGYGLQNFYEILDAAKDINAGWVIVEQDNPSMGKTPLECAEMSIKYLKSIF